MEAKCAKGQINVCPIVFFLFTTTPDRRKDIQCSQLLWFESNNWTKQKVLHHEEVTETFSLF